MCDRLGHIVSRCDMVELEHCCVLLVVLWNMGILLGQRPHY